jgi:hypothetical protein
LHAVKRRKPKSVGHILLGNCFTKHVVERKIEERIEVTARWKRRRRQLLDNFKDKIGNWALNEEALDLTLWELASEVLSSSRKTDCCLMIP